MDRPERPKLKKAIVSLKKLDMSREVPRIETKKGNADSFEDNEDPNSETISTVSAESNVVCTDDDDLEKKIQAFSIPVKKDEDEIKIYNTENAAVPKSDVLEKESESSKLGKKVTFSDSKQTKLKDKESKKLETTSSSDSADMNEHQYDSASCGKQQKKEKLSKNVLKTKDEAKQIEEKASVDQVINKKGINTNFTSSKSKDDQSPPENKVVHEKHEEILLGRRKVSKGGQSVNKEKSATKFKVLRKRKIQDEDNPIHTKKTLIRRNDSVLSRKQTTSNGVKKDIKKNIVKVLKSETTKKKKLISRSLPKQHDKSQFKVKRSTRFSSKNNNKGSKEIKGSENAKRNNISISKYMENQSNVKNMIKKRHSIKKVINSPPTNVRVDKKTVKKEQNERENVKEKNSSNFVQKKDKANSQKSKAEITNLRESDQPTSMFTGKRNSLGDQTKPGSDLLDYGEDLLEKICDIFEDSSKIADFSSDEKKYIYSKFHPYRQWTVSSNTEKSWSGGDTFFKPKIPQKHHKFPPEAKGTVLYQKLWKFSQYIKMPSNAWSLHKHPDGNFVVVFHTSEKSPFPNLLIDKCIIFKGTASPIVKIYDKEVLALRSKTELETLGSVCLFLKYIHSLSLCEGHLSLTEENAKDRCKLYSDGKVLTPYKCELCL